MFSHVYISVNDFEKSFSFYSNLLPCLKIKLKFRDDSVPWAAWYIQEKRPLFIIGKPYDGKPHAPGNGQMIAFQAEDRASVDRAYGQAIADGGKCEGKPGLRPQYHEQYYGAYIRDLDGNKVCIACHGVD